MNHSLRAWAILATIAFVGVAAEDKEKVDKKYLDATAKIVLPSRDSVDALLQQAPQFKETIEWVMKKENWARAIKNVHDRVGLFYADGVPLTVRFSLEQNAPPAEVQAKAGPGQMTIHLPAFANEVKTFPSIGTLGLVTHEYTHVVQYNKGEGIPNQWPLWLIEGMATFTANVEKKYIVIWAQKEPPHSLDEPVKDQVDAPYAWGFLFLEYLKATAGEKKMQAYVDLLINKKTDYRKAAESATGKTWADIVKEELAWKTKYIQEYYKAQKSK